MVSSLLLHSKVQKEGVVEHIEEWTNNLLKNLEDIGDKKKAY